MKQQAPFSLEVPPVVPFKDDLWKLSSLSDEELTAELIASHQALNRPETFEKKLIGFKPPIE